MCEASGGSERVLVAESLQETLYRLEEVRQRFRISSDAGVQEALEWVLGRQGLKGSYRGLFAPTEKDLFEGLQMLTGERYAGRDALTRHILGEEALRAAILWNRRSFPAVAEALESFEKMLEGGARETGFYCCRTCTAAFLRTLSVVKPDDCDLILEKGLNNVRKARTPNGRWQSFPFYYTLLTLSEMDVLSAEAELRHASKAAEGLLKRYRNKNDRASRFRRLGLEAALNAV